MIDLTAMVRYAGVGHHIVAVEMDDPNKVILWAKFLIAVPVFYLIAAALPKLVILSIFMRIFTSKTQRIACYVLGAIITCSSIVTVFIAVFQCIPIEYVWDKTIPGGHCIDINAFFLWASFPNILTDSVMLFLPLPVVWKLQTSNHVKLGLTLTFLTGSMYVPPYLSEVHVCSSMID